MKVEASGSLQFAKRMEETFIINLFRGRTSWLNKHFRPHRLSFRRLRWFCVYAFGCASDARMDQFLYVFSDLSL